MKALFATYPTGFHTAGGGEVQLLVDRDHLPQVAVVVSQYDLWRPRFDEHDVVPFAVS
ncbi:hypothetical protein [Hydrogenophaga sp. PAMC20947]|uniref:hypothetical protein n=1 Tax=Hydrogenophaga sp. PAMC20947 TaxID=2565558 RepID=UPI0014483342|nr:hypothetical protein [Hydrogenophaga sp. PAMC20947]